MYSAAVADVAKLLVKSVMSSRHNEALARTTLNASRQSIDAGLWFGWSGTKSSVGIVVRGNRIRQNSPMLATLVVSAASPNISTATGIASTNPMPLITKISRQP